jgi:DeoR/GlpR family transcriptional regulator of sugar metabolism
MHEGSRTTDVLSAERRARIVERVRAAGGVRAAELTAEFGVSADTIRRDLDELARAGLLARVHGGALPPGPAATGPYAARRRRGAAAKTEIARAAAALARPGQVIVLDGGTTTLQVARCLAPDLRADVVTNSPPIAMALADRPGVAVTLVGGCLRPDALVTVGSETVAAFRDVRADLCYLGVCALHPEIGITCTDLEERHVKRAMIDGSAQVVALANAEKLGTAGPFVIGALRDLTHLVTDRSASRATLEPYRAVGVDIVRA